MSSGPVCAPGPSLPRLPLPRPRGLGRSAAARRSRFSDEPPSPHPEGLAAPLGLRLRAPPPAPLIPRAHWLAPRPLTPARPPPPPASASVVLRGSHPCRGWSRSPYPQRGRLPLRGPRPRPRAVLAPPSPLLPGSALGFPVGAPAAVPAPLLRPARSGVRVRPREAVPSAPSRRADASGVRGPCPPPTPPVFSRPLPRRMGPAPSGAEYRRGAASAGGRRGGRTAICFS